MSIESSVKVEVNHVRDYEFNVKFGLDDVDDLLLDEPEPLGKQRGPNASRLLAAAIVNCLCASLFMCLSKARVEVSGMKATATASFGRNDDKRLRIVGVKANIDLGDTDLPSGRMQRCFDLFEQFCVVTASVRQGIPVAVTVSSAGTTLFSGN